MKKAKIRKTYKAPSLENITKALENSGYLLEQSICPILEQHGYKVQTNIHYKDVDTGKSCEFDVEASKYIDLAPNTDVHDGFHVIILVSCKNNHFPVIGFTRKIETIFSDMPPVGLLQYHGAPFLIRHEPLEHYFNFYDFHHYYNLGYVAKQYCIISTTKKRKEEEYAAIHGDLFDDIYKMCKVIQVMADGSRSFMERCANSLKGKEEEAFIRTTVIYPVMLFGGELYECRLSARHFDILRKNHIVLWQEITSQNLETELAMDMIEESYLPKYLRMVEKEIKTMKNRFLKDIKIMRKAAFNDLLQIKKRLEE